MRPLFAKYPSSVLVDAGGWTERTNPDRPELRSRLYLEGMRELGLAVANLNTRDLRFGPGILRWASDSLGVDLISANVYARGSPLVKPYVLQSRSIGGQTVRIAIAGVTAEMRGSRDAWPDSMFLEVRDPLAATHALWEQLEAQSDVQILLAGLPAEELERIARDQPGWDVLVSGTGDLREATSKIPAVVAPGTKCKFSAWVGLRITDSGEVAVLDSGVLQLDTSVADDAAMAGWVEAAKKRLGSPPTAAVGHPLTAGHPEH